MQTPDLDLGGAFEPHVGHLILTTRLVYKVIFSTLGVGYLPFQLLTVGVVVLTAGMFFAYAGRRVGKLAALAPTLVLLVFGSDSGHLLSGNGFTVIGALACGLGALLALDRDDRTGDVIACALLCLGVVTYSVALPFVVGAAVAIALREDRWRRAWIVGIPVAIYVAWWLWALGSDTSSESQISLDDVLLFPSWAYQSLSGVLGALAGFDYSFGDGTINAGPTLAVLALIGVGWRLQRGPVPKMVWAALAIALSLWLMGSVSVALIRTPDSSRYLYPGALAVLIAGAWLAAGLGWRRSALVALFLLAATGVVTNLALLRDDGALTASRPHSSGPSWPGSRSPARTRTRATCRRAVRSRSGSRWGRRIRPGSTSTQPNATGRSGTRRRRSAGSSSRSECSPTRTWSLRWDWP